MQVEKYTSTDYAIREKNLTVSKELGEARIRRMSDRLEFPSFQDLMAIDTALGLLTGVLNSLKLDGKSLPTIEAERNTAIQTAIDGLVNSAPGLLNTLKEIADAMGNDPDLKNTVLNQITTVQNALQTQINTLQDNLLTVGNFNALLNSISIIEANISSLQSSVTAEITARSLADSSLQTEIDTEETERQNADVILQSNIDAETTARQTTDSNLATEVTARQNADVTLQANIDAETTARNLAIQTEINNLVDSAPGILDTLGDIATALGNDPNLASTITNLINTESTDRTTADTTLQSNIDTEVTARQTTDSNLATEITARQTTDLNLATEITDRQNADTTLQSNIDAEVTARQTTDSNLATEITNRQNADDLKGYTLVFGAGGFNPLDSTSYFIGNQVFKTPPTSSSSPYRVKAFQAGIIKAMNLTVSYTGAGSSEAVTFKLRNVTTVTEIDVTTTRTIDAYFADQYSSLNLPVNAGDEIEIEMVCPAWVTNPTSLGIRAELFVV